MALVPYVFLVAVLVPCLWLMVRGIFDGREG
jgi:hypothetical protein